MAHRSQRGPLAATPFVSVPSNRFSKFDPQSFRVLLRRRLRLPIPFVFEILQVWRQLDPPQMQEFGGDVVSLWKRQQHTCAVKLEEGFLPTCLSHGPGSVQPVRQPQAGSVCGTDRSWRLTQHWSLHCTVMEQPEEGSRPQWGRTAQESGHVPRIHRGYGSRPIGRLGCRGGRTVLHKNGCFLECAGQGKVSVCSSIAERSCEGLLHTTTLGGDLGMQCSSVFCHVPLGEETHVRNRDPCTRWCASRGSRECEERAG